MKKIGFIGCGTMGKPMALTLIKAGYPVTVHDLNPTPVEELVREGATGVNSPREVAEQSEVIITMLTSSPHVEQVMLGPDGAIEHLKRGSVIIDMSTINPFVTQKIAAVAEAKGIEMLDSPVGSGEQSAMAGTLPLFVGGKRETLEEYRDILEVMGETILHVGEVGMGAVVKLSNQLISAICGIAMCEAFVFGTKLGADPKILFEAFSTSGARIMWNKAPFPDVVPQSPANRDFDEGFTTELMIKDLGLVQEAAATLQMPVLGSNLARDLIMAAGANGFLQKDWTVVRKIIEGLAGTRLNSTPET